VVKIIFGVQDKTVIIVEIIARRQRPYFIKTLGIREGLLRFELSGAVKRVRGKRYYRNI